MQTSSVVAAGRIPSNRPIHGSARPLLPFLSLPLSLSPACLTAAAWPCSFCVLLASRRELMLSAACLRLGSTRCDDHHHHGRWSWPCRASPKQADLRDTEAALTTRLSLRRCTRRRQYNNAPVQFIPTQQEQLPQAPYRFPARSATPCCHPRCCAGTTVHAAQTLSQIYTFT